jgi:hypothetical protein
MASRLCCGGAFTRDCPSGLKIGALVATLLLLSQLSLGLATKARACEGVRQGNPRVTFHAPRSVGKCEGMNPHTPK